MLLPMVTSNAFNWSFVPKTDAPTCLYPSCGFAVKVEVTSTAATSTLGLGCTRQNCELGAFSGTLMVIALIEPDGVFEFVATNNVELGLRSFLRLPSTCLFVTRNTLPDKRELPSTRKPVPVCPEGFVILTIASSHPFS